jgi:hypothetical protein
MSEQPPHSPYGPAYGGPPGQPPSKGMSNKAKFWIGVVVALPAIIVAGIISGAVSAVVEGVGGDPALGAAVAGVVGLGLFAGFIVLVVFEGTRWVALGMLAGTAILFILAAGACVVLLIGLSQSYN